MVAVHHAELVALWLGEPYGTLVLTLAVTIIELSLIVSLMLTGEPSPGAAARHGACGGDAGAQRPRRYLHRGRHAASPRAGVPDARGERVPRCADADGDPGSGAAQLHADHAGPLLLDPATDLRRQHLPRAVPGVPVRADRAPPGLLRADGRDRGRACRRAIGAYRCDQRRIAGAVAGRGHLARQVARAVHRAGHRRGRCAVQAGGRDRCGDRAVAGILRRLARGAAQSTADQHQPGPRQRGGLHRAHCSGRDGDRDHG